MRIGLKRCLYVSPITHSFLLLTETPQRRGDVSFVTILSVIMYFILSDECQDTDAATPWRGAECELGVPWR